MASRRRELATTDETTLSEGLRRNVELEDVADFAQATGLPIDRILHDTKIKDALSVAATGKHFSKPVDLQGAKTPKEILQKTLSIRSVLSTSSSFAERMEALRGTDPAALKLAEIGRGSFGTVYEIPGTAWCLKKTLKAPQDLWKEFTLGSHISLKVNVHAATAVSQSEKVEGSLMPRVPRYLCSYGMQANQSPEKWFALHGKMFPSEYGGQKPGAVNCLERILPLPQIIRDNLIKVYFKPEKQAQALADPGNKACICRAYLGCTSKDEDQVKLDEQRETLRNFPLYLDQIEDLEMDPFTIARDMALGLAAGHWAANVNMLDVEFVIGSRPHEPDFEIKPISKQDLKAASHGAKRRMRNMSADQDLEERKGSFRNRAIQLWMIDFNKVDRTNCSVDSIQDYHANILGLVHQTRSTDGPYYPRAIARNEWEWELWLAFAKAYVVASKAILRDTMEAAEEVGYTSATSQKDRILERPSLVIEQWVKVEAEQANTTRRAFLKVVRVQGWRHPNAGTEN